MQNQFTIHLTRQQLAQMVQSLSVKECEVLIRLLQIKIAQIKKENPDPPFQLPQFDGDYLDRPLSSFGIDKRIVTRLANQGYSSARDVMEADYNTFMTTRNIGGKTWQEIKQKVIEPYLEM